MSTGVPVSVTVTVGTYHEKGRRIQRCPSYYAADYEVLDLVPGDYPLRLTFEGGYMVPMPYWILARIDALRVEGALFSGYGGVNFGRTDLPAGEAVTYGLQTYRYLVPQMVADGDVTLAPGFEWLLADMPWTHADAPKTWEAVSDLREAEHDAHVAEQAREASRTLDAIDEERELREMERDGTPIR